MTITVARTVSEIREYVAIAKNRGMKTCVVPTMGGLHAGHLSLVKKANEVAEFVIVTLFVNPTQFNNQDDLKNYPGDENEDLAALARTKTNAVFAPNAEEMYPFGFATSVVVNAGRDILCDAHRPGHFGGVATVCTKLFLQTGADFACFGEKDYQQLFIIKTLVRDLNIPIEIVPVETVREADGLAMSSRNKRLTEAERKIAARLHEQMQNAAKDIRDGKLPEAACLEARHHLSLNSDFRVEYFEARSADSLDLVKGNESPARIFAAAWLGSVRLIDNIAI